MSKNLWKKKYKNVQDCTKQENNKITPKLGLISHIKSFLKMLKETLKNPSVELSLDFIKSIKPDDKLVAFLRQIKRIITIKTKVNRNSGCI